MRKRTYSGPGGLVAYDAAVVPPIATRTKKVNIIKPVTTNFSFSRDFSVSLVIESDTIFSTGTE